MSHLVARAVLVTLLWAANFVLTQAALDAHMTPLLLTGARFALASILVIITPKPAGIGWSILAALGVGLGVGQFGLATLAMQAGLPPGVTALVLQAQCLVTMGLASVFLGERLSPRTLAGTALALLGFAGLVTFGSPCRLGMLMAGGAAVAAAGFNILIKRLASSADSVGLAVWISPFPVLPLLALSYTVEGPPLATFHGADPAITALAIVYGGLISTVVGTALWTRLLHQAPASTVAPFTLLIPVFGTALSAAIDQKQPEASAILPFGAVLIGLALAHCRIPDRFRFGLLSRVRVGA